VQWALPCHSFSGVKTEFAGLDWMSWNRRVPVFVLVGISTGSAVRKAKGGKRTDVPIIRVWLCEHACVVAGRCHGALETGKGNGDDVSVSAHVWEQATSLLMSQMRVVWVYRLNVAQVGCCTSLLTRTGRSQQ